ncbi:MAG: type II secretion system protein GspN [Deltaproteobacteria bacterium]
MTRPKTKFFWIGLGLYGLLAFFLFTLYRLPADKVLGKALTLGTQTQTRVSAETVSFSLPLSYALEKILFEAQWPQGVSKDRIDSLRFGPEWSRILSGSFPLRIEAVSARARAEAGLGLPFLGQGYFYARASTSHLEDISFMEVVLGRSVSGKGEAEVRLLGDVRFPSGLNGRGFLRITDGSVESKLPLAGLRSIPFQSFSANLVVQEGVLYLSDGELAGPAVSGTFSGQVKLDNIMSRSVLNITALLTPGRMLDENDMARRMLASLAPDGGPIPVHLRGTFGSPSIRWGKE